MACTLSKRKFLPATDAGMQFYCAVLKGFANDEVEQHFRAIRPQLKSCLIGNIPVSQESFKIPMQIM